MPLLPPVIKAVLVSSFMFGVVIDVHKWGASGFLAVF
jgi:hypothetical protein